jgi:DNA-binding SARP family transcriptional activator
MVEARLLGPVEPWSGDGQIPLGPRQRRCILAALALTPGRPVTAESLVDRMWDGALPRDPRNVLYTNISRLRSDLARAGVTVQRRENGYVLDLAAENIDVHRARQLAARARSLVAEHPDNASEAVELLRSASTLWRDLPLMDLHGEWADRVRYGLTQERVAMISQRFELELMIGQHADAVGPLADLVAEYPLDESLAALLMLALYRCGRQVDALGVFTRLRRRLVDEIGDEPGTHAQDLHDKILRRDATLEWPDLRGVMLHHEVPAANSAAMPLELTSRPAQLPPDVAGFVGRADALAALDELVPRGNVLPTAVVIAISDGAAGVGKTALAVHWAHRVRNRFPDGQLYADLRGYASDAPLEPLEVLAQFLRALGVPAEMVPGEVTEASAMYRSVLADRRVLVLLDNAATAEQVRPLVAGGAGSMVLVTSRDHLSGLVARDGACRVGLGTLSRAEAVSLLTALLGADRQQADLVSIGELAEFCAYLPLALRVAAANLVARPEFSISEYLAEAQCCNRLAVLAVPDDPKCAVGEALDLSYVRLPESARRMFRFFGLLPGVEVDAEAAARLAGTEVDAAARTLGVLANAHLIEERASGRFACHDLLRDYATIRAAQEERSAECDAARRRYFDYYVEMTDAVADVAFPQAVRVRHRESTPGPLSGGRVRECRRGDGMA